LYNRDKLWVRLKKLIGHIVIIKEVCEMKGKANDLNNCEDIL